MGEDSGHTLGEVAAHVSSLLCELHAHTTWSDGELSVGTLVDLYGAAGFDRVELFSGGQLFSWVAREGLMPVACGDLHSAEHLPGWATIVHCERDAEALVDYLRSSRPASLIRLGQTPVSLAA